MGAGAVECDGGGGLVGGGEGRCNGALGGWNEG